MGARFFKAEAGDGWATHGLGYYLASRILWDTGEAERSDETLDEFFTNCFGQHADKMKEYYDLLYDVGFPILSDTLIDKMYNILRDVLAQTRDSAIEARLFDLIQYTRYVELFHKYSSALLKKCRQNAFQELIMHAYRMRETMMVHTKALYKDLDKRDRRVSIPENALWNVPAESNPWKIETPYSEEEIKAFLSKENRWPPIDDQARLESDVE